MGDFLEDCAHPLRHRPNFLTAFLGVEVEHQKMTNFHRYLWFNQAKIPIKSWAYGARVERNFQEIDPRGQFLKHLLLSNNHRDCS